MLKEDDVLGDRATMALFQKIGLSANEAKCFIASLSLGPSAIREVATRAGVNRVNAYGAVKALAERGLIKLRMTPSGREVIPGSLEQLQAVALDHQKKQPRCDGRLRS